MKAILAALESATTAGTRVSLLMNASSIVLAGCAAHVQDLVRQTHGDMGGSLSRFTDDYARRVVVAIDLGHLATEWLCATRRELERVLAVTMCVFHAIADSVPR